MNETFTDSKTRLSAFLDNTNGILVDCGLSGVYIANPYECFLLFCLSTDYPMGTYADVIEMSYDEEI